MVFPLTVYEGYFREHKYGLSNLSFGQWMRDQAVGLAVAAVLGAILLAALFWAVRRTGKNWWMWGSTVYLIFVAFVALIAPVFISPLFNKYTKLEDPRFKGPILSLARANGIPATDVYVVDASRQSDRVSANVSGFGGTTRITLNDNLLRRCSLAGIESTMGHEMGHYVLNHQFKGLVLEGVLAVLMFALLNWGLQAGLARRGESWRIRGIGDLAVLPFAALLLTVFSFVLTPVSNTVTRTMEYEADMYGINAGQQPDGEAEVDLMLGEYRKLDPGPIEEFIFFDHPSGRTRITVAMRWKAEHLPGAPLGK
jgi:STE24 endopeptidase